MEYSLSTNFSSFELSVSFLREAEESRAAPIMLYPGCSAAPVMLCPWCHAVPSMPCPACKAMPFPWDSAVLAAPGAKEIPPHVKYSWGGLLTWILFSVSLLQPPLLPNYTWPGWSPLQRGEGIRASHHQGRGLGETPIQGMFGVADPVQAHWYADWESES